MSLIEAMISMALLTIGLVGALNGILVATRQNSIANRMTRASAIAFQVRNGLTQLGPDHVVQNLLDSTNCTSDDTLKAYAGPIGNVTSPATPCFVDLDSHDAAAEIKAVPGYSDPDHIYRRVLAYFADDQASHKIYTIAVIVSWNDGGQRHFHHQFLAFYDPTNTKTGVVEL
jgi:type II secretory pathway pseudopilin PulG